LINGFGLWLEDGRVWQAGEGGRQARVIAEEGVCAAAATVAASSGGPLVLCLAISHP